MAKVDLVLGCENVEIESLRYGDQRLQVTLKNVKMEDFTGDDGTIAAVLDAIGKELVMSHFDLVEEDDEEES